MARGLGLNEIARKAKERMKRGRPEHQSLESALARQEAEMGDTEQADVGGEAKPETALQVVQNQMTVIEEEHARLLAPYEDGLPFDLDRIKQRILACGVNILEEMVSIGKYLIWTKEKLDHGSFVEWLDGELGMSRYRAAEFMRVAQRVIESKCAHVRTFLHAAAGDSKKKLMALLEVSDEEVEEVMEKETFLGKSLDEFEAMSVRQLRDALRTAREGNIKLREGAKGLKAKLEQTKADLEAEKNRDSAEAPLSPRTELENRLMDVIERLGKTEDMATEYAEEFGDEGLMDPEFARSLKSLLATVAQKHTSIFQIVTPDQLRDGRLYVAEQPKEEGGDEGEVA